MPTTLTALLILLFAIVPGMFGEMVYRIIAGTDWRETQWSKVARIIGISIAGLVLHPGQPDWITHTAVPFPGELQ